MVKAITPQHKVYSSLLRLRFRHGGASEITLHREEKKKEKKKQHFKKNH